MTTDIHCILSQLPNSLMLALLLTPELVFGHLDHPPFEEDGRESAYHDASPNQEEVVVLEIDCQRKLYVLHARTRQSQGARVGARIYPGRCQAQCDTQVAEIAGEPDRSVAAGKGSIPIRQHK